MPSLLSIVRSLRFASLLTLSAVVLGPAGASSARADEDAEPGDEPAGEHHFVVEHEDSPWPLNVGVRRWLMSPNDMPIVTAPADRTLAQRVEKLEAENRRMREELTTLRHQIARLALAQSDPHGRRSVLLGDRAMGHGPLDERLERIEQLLRERLGGPRRERMPRDGADRRDDQAPPAGRRGEAPRPDAPRIENEATVRELRKELERLRSAGQEGKERLREDLERLRSAAQQGEERLRDAQRALMRAEAETARLRAEHEALKEALKHSREGNAPRGD